MPMWHHRDAHERYIPSADMRIQTWRNRERGKIFYFARTCVCVRLDRMYVKLRIIFYTRIPLGVITDHHFNEIQCK